MWLLFCRRCGVKAINKAMEKIIQKTLLCGFILLSGLWAGQLDSWVAVGGAVMECYQCEGERARCDNNFATLRPCPPNTTSCRFASRHTAASPFLSEARRPMFYRSIFNASQLSVSFISVSI